LGCGGVGGGGGGGGVQLFKSSKHNHFHETWNENEAIRVQVKNKNQLDASYYFIVLLRGSTCFGHYYARHQELATIMLITTLFVSYVGPNLQIFEIDNRLGAVRLE